MENANTSVKKILQNNYAENEYHTHVSMIKPRGRFVFNREALESFWDSYQKSDEVLGIAEKPQQYIPVLVDVDIKVPKDDILVFGEHLYTEAQVLAIIKYYQDVLSDTVQDIEKKHLTCVLLEKPIYEDGVYQKNGFHLHFPKIFLNKDDIKKYIIPRIQKLVKEAETFKNLGLTDEKKIIDDCSRNPWLLYGSVKDEDKKPYKLTKIYDYRQSEITLEQAFFTYKIYDQNEQQIPITDNIEYYIPRILSIVPYGRETMELKTGLEVIGVEKIKPKQIRERKPKNPNVNETLKLIQKLLPLLSESRAEDHDDWLKVGWIIHSETNGCDEGLELWLEFSSRCDEKYDEEACRDLWDKMEDKRDGVSMGTLHYYAKTDSPDGYKDVMKSFRKDDIDDCIRGGQTDFGELFYKLRNETIKVVSQKSGAFYYWHETKLIWKLSETKDALMKLIADEIKPMLVEKAIELMKELASTIDEAQSSSIKAYLAQVQKQITNLKSTTYLNNIVKFYINSFDIDEEFLKHMNKRKDALPIKNGMLIDLRTGELRERTPEDKFSFELKVSYNPDEDCKFENVLKFFNEITQDDKDMIQYYKRFWGYCLTGETSDRSLHVFWGEGKNGKSTLINICKKILGDYYSVLDETVMTKTVVSRGPTPELVPLAKCRVATLPESEDGEKINSKRLKTITGDDMITYRDCHCPQTTCETQAKCIMPTNHKPKININDTAVVDRIKLVPFLARFDETPENVKYIQDIYDKHLDEFFTWYVRGAVEWYSGKTLTPVECMTKEKDEFINEQDTFKDFLEETFEPVITRQEYDVLQKELKINNRMPKSVCISMMLDYNMTTGVRMSKPDITKSFQKHGVEALKIKGVDYYIIKRKQEEIPEATPARLLGGPPI